MLNRRRCDADSGSVLMLMPAAILIVLVLGAIAVDMSVVHLAKRELVDSASAAANDAVTVGLDEDGLRRGDGYSIDSGRAQSAVNRSLDAAGVLDRLSAPPTVIVNGADQVEVELVMQVDYVFAKALPGNTGHTTLRAVASATARRL